MKGDLIPRLRGRAVAARNEGTATALGDALHLEEAADALATLTRPEPEQAKAVEISPYEFMAREFDRLAILRKMWSAGEVAAIIRKHEIPTPPEALAEVGTVPLSLLELSNDAFDQMHKMMPAERTRAETAEARVKELEKGAFRDALVVVYRMEVVREKRYRLGAERRLEAAEAALSASRARVGELTAELTRMRDFGCPVCGGDCAAANPSVDPHSCPMQRIHALLTKEPS